MAAIEMSQAMALARLRDMVSYDCNPALSDEELDRLLAFAVMPDRWGLEPTDTGWTPTYELNSAAAQGWRQKAGKAASDASFTADGSSYSRKEVIENCKSMAAEYEGRVVRGVSYIERLDSDEVVGN